MQSSEIIDAFKELACNLGYQLICEKGNFNTGDCLIHSEKKIVVNKNAPVESQIHDLAKLFSTFELSNLYVLPKIRKLIDDARQITIELDAE
ncbi:hypothetical protein H8D59_02460 [bacterium]|nr:hypothetical protein [bacterium]MBL7052503.1 hypothetical protein [Candidatus Neomarinimicrobiota bacterium]